MRRRDLVLSLAGAALTAPRAAREQPPPMPVVGVLFDGTREIIEAGNPPLAAGLKETGFVEGRNVAVVYRVADGHYDRLPDLAAGLVAQKVAVIMALGAAAFAAKAATSSIPIVFATGVDPVTSGLVASLNRPGGNVTGSFVSSSALTAKQLELLKRLVPAAVTVGFLANPKFPDTEAITRNAQAGARRLGLDLLVVHASTTAEIDAGFATLVDRHAGALLVAPDPLLASERGRIVDLAIRHGLPAMSFVREFATAGGLASYGASLAESNRQSAVYVGRILRGAKPADLPVIQSEKFDLVLNAKTAKTLGVEIPPTILALADEVIE